jgi:hypothetical protein
MSKILFSAPLATAVLAVGLLVPVTTASAGVAGATPAAVALGSASPADFASEVSAKRRNLLSNPSFERGTFGWKVSHGRLAGRSERQAPDGKRVAQVSVAKKAAKSARLTAKTQAVSQAGQRYQATAHVAAGNRRTVGKKARLVVRELAGQKVVSQKTGRKVTLKSGYRNLATRVVAKGSGNRLEVFVELIKARRGNAFHADDIRLEVRRRPSGQPLGAGGPVNRLLSITLGQEEHWGNTSQYGTMVVYGWEADRIAEIKARNPNTRVLMYVEAGATYRRTDCSSMNNPQSFQVSHASWGVDMCWMLANGHDDWVLRNSDGSYAEFTDYAGFLLMDMANPAFAKEWARNMVQAAKSLGFDGVWADDVNTRVGHGLSNIHRQTGGGLVPVSDAQYGDGTVSWARKVEAEMDSIPGGKALTFAANVFADPWDPTASAQALKIAKSVDLFNKEHQAQWTVGLSCGPFKSMEPAEINAIMEFARRIQDTGASYSAIDYGAGPLTDRDRQVMTFGRSMFLLGWNGNPGAAYFFRPCGSVDPADTRWTTELGAPTGAVEKLRTETVRLPGQDWDQEAHVLKRDFALGMVLQNQLPFSVTVQLDGTYKTQDGRTVSGSITIPGATWFKAGPSWSQPAEQGLPGGAALLTRVG